jgi:uncharacterized phage protein gp47/JayE
MIPDTPSFEVLRSRYLADLRDDRNDPSTDSDNAVRASSVAAIVEGLYAEIQWLYRQIWAMDADDDELDRHARDRGMARKPSVAAIGTCRLTGRAGTQLPSGALLRHSSGSTMATVSAAVIDDEGTATVRVVAQEAGKSANGLGGRIVLISPPAGIDASASLEVPLAGGSDQESSLSLLNRYLDVIRRPPAGGNQYDYRRWAREVPGVADAWVYPLRGGLGTVDVAIVGDDGLPNPELIEAVGYAIEIRRPAGGRAGKVFAPKELFVDVLADVMLADGYRLEEVMETGRKHIAAAFRLLAPGEVLRRSQLEGILSNLPGVTDRALLTPPANVVPGAGHGDTELEWIRLGRFAMEPMK